MIQKNQPQQSQEQLLEHMLTHAKETMPLMTRFSLALPEAMVKSCFGLIEEDVLLKNLLDAIEDKKRLQGLR